MMSSSDSLELNSDDVEKLSVMPPLALATDTFYLISISFGIALPGTTFPCAFQPTSCTEYGVHRG